MKDSIEVIAGCRTRLMRGGSGAPLLYLHGPDGARAWTPFFARLAERFEVIVPEHPGYGGSDMPGWLDNVQDLAYFYLDALEHFRLQRVHLAGLSLGGWIACEMAVRERHSFISLALLAPHGLRVKGVAKADIFLLPPESYVRHLYHDSSLADARLARALTEDEQDAVAKNRLTTARLGWEPRLYDPHLHKWMHRIQAPTLVLWGEHDRMIPPAYGAAFRDAIAGARLDIVPGVGHALDEEKADDVARRLIAFAAEADR